MMFAQILPEPGLGASIGWFFITIAAIAAGLNQISALWHRHKDRPSGGEVMKQAHETFATKPELATAKAELSKRIEDVDEELEKQKDSIVRNGETRKASIEGKVEALRLELKKDIEGTSEDIQQTGRDVCKLEGKFDQINVTLIGLTSAVQNLQNNQGKS
jgi:hypothetical protein